MAVTDSLVYTVLEWSAQWTVKDMSNKFSGVVIQQKKVPYFLMTLMQCVLELCPWE
jgi:hypothetical protein